MAGVNPGRKVEHDEWIAFPRRYLPEGSMDQIYPNERTHDELPPVS